VQAEKGNWNYNLKAVYCVGVLNFTFDDYESEPEKSEVVHTIKLKNQPGKTFYDKLTYLYLEMPNFVKAESDIVTRLHKWLFFIKNLEAFKAIPVIFSDKIFVKAFEKAELAKMGEPDLYNYKMNLKIYRDYKNTVDFAFDEGKLEGIKEEKQEGIMKFKLEIAGNMKRKGLSVKDIASLTGLSEVDIEKL